MACITLHFFFPMVQREPVCGVEEMQFKTVSEETVQL